MSELEFRAVPDKPGYRVGNDGTVWSCWTPGRKPRMSEVWRQLKGNRQKYGHLSIMLGGRDYRFVHRLVLEAFIGPCPAGYYCRHLNGDALDNRLENLAWGTPLENSLDRVAHGRSREGVGTRGKLTADQVLAILEMCRDGMTHRAIGERFGVTQGAVHAIAAGRSWNHVTGLPRPASVRGQNREACKRWRAERRLRKSEVV